MASPRTSSVGPAPTKLGQLTDIQTSAGQTLSVIESFLLETAGRLGVVFSGDVAAPSQPPPEGIIGIAAMQLRQLNSILNRLTDINQAL